MSHRFPLLQTAPQVSTPAGFRSSATKANFPILKGLSVYRLVVHEGCFREPHWHANADELSYCVKGRALVTVFSSGNVHAQFTIGPGEMFFVPSGSLHCIENCGEGDVEFVITFSHEEVEDFGLSGFAGVLTPAVVANTWNLPASALEGLTRSADDLQFGRLAAPVSVPESAAYPHPLKFPIEAREPLLANEDGSAIVARRDTWPALRAQAMYSLRMKTIGMREPHWHPETAELGYVLAGHARMTVKSPGASAETYELQAGDIYFIPRAYPHHIENLGGGEMRFLIFFDTPDVQDIGFSGGVPAFPDRTTGPTLGLTQEQMAAIPRLTADLLIVPKRNPLDAPSS
jgi:oxalate decarboxylase